MDNWIDRTTELLNESDKEEVAVLDHIVGDGAGEAWAHLPLRVYRNRIAEAVQTQYGLSREDAREVAYGVIQRLAAAESN